MNYEKFLKAGVLTHLELDRYTNLIELGKHQDLDKISINFMNSITFRIESYLLLNQASKLVTAISSDSCKFQHGYSDKYMRVLAKASTRHMRRYRLYCELIPFSVSETQQNHSAEFAAPPESVESNSQEATNQLLSPDTCPNCRGCGFVYYSPILREECPLCCGLGNIVMFSYINNTLVSNPPFFNFVSWLRRSFSLLFFQCRSSFRIQANKPFEGIGG